MSNNIEPFSSNIFSTGNRFIVTDKTTDGTFGPGTIGIISYVKGVDTYCTNVVYLSTVVLKRGKTGKIRLDTEQVSAPIFNFGNMAASDIMPDKKRKRYIYIKPEIPKEIEYTIFDMSNIDYLGWALSWIRYLYQLLQYTKPFGIWPAKNSNIMNRMLEIDRIWKENEGYAIEEYCNKTSRKKFTEHMRIMESTLVNCSLSYMLKIAEIEVQAIKYLIRCNENKTKKICENKLLEVTLNTFIEKHASLKLLKSKNSSLLKNGNKIMPLF